MYAPSENSTTEVIYDTTCHIPFYGYGIDVATGKRQRTDIIKRSSKVDEQFWERTPLPADWNKKRAHELANQKFDADFIDAELEKFRKQEWKRRLCGVWFYNHGKPIYLTGEHYMYLNWWHLDDGYPKFREPDRKRYYFQQYCIEDPLCAGMVEASNRRSGKSYRGGLFIYEATSRSNDVNGGMQSKTDIDIKNLFKGKIVTPFKRLPDFFRPGIDAMAGTNPEKELKFTTTSTKGKKAMESFSDLGLNSFINYLSSDQYAYDGWKLFRYLGDEVGKTAIVDVYDRWQVVKYCLRVGGNWVGKALLTTTVEKLKDSKAKVKVAQTPAFKKIWDGSNPDERDPNGHTQTGLYKYFTPAYEMYEFDKYGYPLIEEGKTFYLNTRAALMHDPRALSSEISKNPFTESELFFTDGEKCLWNAMKLNEQKDWLSWHKELIERGNFVWKNGERFSEVVWEKNKYGHWWMPVSMVVENPNNVIQQNGKYFPGNNLNFRGGCDPFKYDKVKDARRSDCAAAIGKMFDPSKPSDVYNDSFVCIYCYRAPTTGMSNEDILKMCWYFGCQMLFEKNVDHWKAYFIENKCEAFLMKLEGEDDYGIYNDGHSQLLQSICDLLEDHIERDFKKIWFESVIDEYLEFDVGTPTRYDKTIATGLCRVAMKKKNYRRMNDKPREITEYFTIHKAV